MPRDRTKKGQNTRTIPTTATKREIRTRSHDTLQLAAGTSSDGEVVSVGGTAAVYGNKLQKPKIESSSALFSEIKATDHFVDKTKMIEVLFDDSKYILITRPRRFGKSTIMNMVKEFVNKKVYTTGDKVGQEILRSTENDRAFPEMNLRLFEDGNLEISKWNEFSRHRGKYPTIHLDFQTIGRGNDYLGILLEFRNVVTSAFDQHQYLLSSTEKQLNRFHKEKFGEYLYPEPTKKAIIESILASSPELEEKMKSLETILSDHITEALPFLAQVLHQHYNHEIYLFIDEYDAPINNTLFINKKFCEKVNDLLTGFFQKLLKRENSFIGRALITGISYMSSVGLSGVNNVKKHMFLRGALGDDRYEVFYGITEEELEELTTKFTEKFWQGVNKLPKEKVASYYNGYQSIGKSGVQIYPIWSIVNALENGELRNYWEQSGIMASARQGLNIPIVRIAIEKLLSGRHIKCEIPYKLELEDLQDLSDVILKWEEKRTLLKPDVFLSFLMQQGYLMYECMNNEKNIEGDIFEVKIPNTLIKNEFSKLIKTYVADDYDYLITCVTEVFEEFPDDPDHLSDEIVKRLISSMQDVFKHVSEKWHQCNEDAYHSVIFHCLCKSSKYMCCTELSGAKGRLDIAFNSENIAIIIEVKYCQSILKAVEQVECKRYVDILRKKLSNENIKCVCMGLNVDTNNKVSIAYKNADKSGLPLEISLKNKD